MTFNNQLSRGRGGAYDGHLQPTVTLAPFSMANYQTLPSPAKQIVVQPQNAGANGQLPLPPQTLQAAPQQYVPVTMVEQNGRQMLAAVQAASWPTTRQMALAVPSWQQLTGGAPSAAAAAAVAAATDNLLQPLFAAAAEADWRRPLIVDSNGSLRLQEQAVFPVVYDRATMVANSAAAAAAAAAAATSREVALVQQQRNYSSSVSGSKRSTKPSQLSLHAINNNTLTINNNPPPAHISSHLYSSSMRYVKKEQTQLSPVKKRIKENKDHYVFADAYSTHSPLEQSHRLPQFDANTIVIHDSPPLHSSMGNHHNIPEVITISDSDDESPPATSQVCSFLQIQSFLNLRHD